jgi:hypothetical protein
MEDLLQYVLPLFFLEIFFAIYTVIVPFANYMAVYRISYGWLWFLDSAGLSLDYAVWGSTCNF